jgi:hypothetical protein
MPPTMVHGAWCLMPHHAWNYVMNNVVMMERITIAIVRAIHSLSADEDHSREARPQDGTGSFFACPTKWRTAQVEGISRAAARVLAFYLLVLTNQCYYNRNTSSGSAHVNGKKQTARTPLLLVTRIRHPRRPYPGRGHDVR